MNKLQLLTTAAKILAVISGASAYADMIPPKFAIPAAIVFAAASTLKDLVRTVGDLLDDGQRNNSFKGID